MTQFIVRKIILVMLVAVIYSCNSEKENKSITSKTQTLFTLLDAKDTGIDFLNKVKNQKNFNIFKYRNFYNGGTGFCCASASAATSGAQITTSPSKGSRKRPEADCPSWWISPRLRLSSMTSV